MAPESRLDTLMRRLAVMNDLLNLISSDEDIDTQSNQGGKRKSGGKKSGGGLAGLFGAAGRLMFFRRRADGRSGILGIIHPSDGHPQEELTPDFNWFRPLSYNNPTWTLYWPELTV
ncbi:MAG: hypothetical protein KGI37_02290 [Alphaproteobacteria bacterium]|nr:hypothetical protein [Alphaproteobacteria bacterium]